MSSGGWQSGSQMPEVQGAVASTRRPRHGAGGAKGRAVRKEGSWAVSIHEREGRAAPQPSTALSTVLRTLSATVHRLRTLCALHHPLPPCPLPFAVLSAARRVLHPPPAPSAHHLRLTQAICAVCAPSAHTLHVLQPPSPTLSATSASAAVLRGRKRADEGARA
ncbi:hypothetical protein DENSPDRAFT_885935 [Dentipellis sp. KUC8613]|nr:hypothetical protein DENSPDRAFT_885935 [Dentipellis sp. KUC8613]